MKVDTGVEIVKCVVLLHSVIIDVGDPRDSSSNDCGGLNANDGTQFKNKSTIRKSVTASAKQRRDLFC